MIINFLQTRKQPVLPNLHQRQSSNQSNGDLNDNTFADDLESLREFGDRNKESLGDLLFGFFRFYAYEFDYENLVVSVRQGTQISKQEKKWHLATNNRLCVEEPFNLGRNLANTADDFSWRGLHLELRRAFDLISEVKLHECCEQYTIPKVQISSNMFEKPPQSKKPVLRSASQSNRGGRGNHRGGGGGRHNNQHGRNASGNRRASSGQYDNPLGYLPGMIPPNLTAQDAWLQQQAQAQLHNDLFATYSVLQAQENNLRLQLYNQSRQYMQAQNQGLPPTQNHSHLGSSTKQQGERNRTTSFDQPPLSAPIRPQELYYYPLQYQQTNVYGYQTPSTNPSSPSLSHAVPERRSVHRTNGTNGTTTNSHSQSALRSHSQPASRSNPAQLNAQGIPVPSPGLGSYQASRQPNGVPVPKVNGNENPNSLVEPAVPHTASSSPDDPTPREYWGYYVSENRQSLMPMQIPAFGEVKQNRRMSTDKLPQSVRDRLRRSSRSPSPLGHDRSHSISTYHVPANAASIRQSVSSTNLHALNNQAPPIVNGSSIAAPISIPQWQASMYERPGVEDALASTSSASLDSSSRFSAASSGMSADEGISGQSTPRDARMEQPMVVNGSDALPSESTSPEHAAMVVNGTGPYSVESQNGLVTDHGNGNSASRSSPNSRKRQTRPMQNGGVSPLDIGLSQSELLREDLPFLSPVYETRTPSPRSSRKFESAMDRKVGIPSKTSEESTATLPAPQKLAPLPNPNKQSLAPNKTNGHARGSKSEGGNSNAWQKAGSKKKKCMAAEPSPAGQGQPLNEKPHKKESERRGG